MERRFHVVYTGRLHAGFKQSETVGKMVSLFQLDREKVASLLASGRPTIMKQGVTWEQAEIFRGRLEQIGLRIKIIEADAHRQPPLADPASKNPTSTSKPVQDIIPEELKSPAPALVKPDDSAGQDAIAGSPPIKVERSHGWLWIKEAFGMFIVQPWRWMRMTVLICIVVIPIMFIPYPAVLLCSVFAPVLTGRIMLGAQRQRDGVQLEFSHLFRDFQHNLAQLLLVGIFCLLGLILLEATQQYCLPRIISILSDTNPNIPEILAVLLRELPMNTVGLLIVAVLFVPLMMGFWFAPCLVALEDRTAFTGFQLSFRAVMINCITFLNYGLVLLLLSMVFLFLIAAISALFFFLLGSDKYFLSMLLPMLSTVMLGIPFITIVLLSIFTGFRDIFYGSEQKKVS
jgi:hypothetical protein